MSQTKTIALVVGLAVVVGGGYLLLKPDSLPNQDEIASETSQESEVGKKMAFSQFLKQGGSYKCSIYQSVNGAETTGTTYINNGMIKGEYLNQAENMTVTAYLIVRDGYTYSWTSLAPNMGFKAKVVDDAVADGSTDTSGSYSFNADQVGDYDCEPWSADASVFALPQGVTFTELN